jgi:PAS domain S-box-containing protein
MAVDQASTGLALLFDSAYQHQPDFHTYVENYLDLLKRDNPFMDDAQLSLAKQTLRVEFYRQALQALGQASFDGLLFMDYGGMVLELNRIAERALACPRELLIGSSLYDLALPPAQREMYLECLRTELQNPDSDFFHKTHEVTLQKATGVVFPAELHMTRLKIFGTSLLVICFNDLTQQKWAEDAIRFNEERYRSIVSNSADAIFLVDAQTYRIFDCNPAFLKLLDYTEDELFALTLQDIMDASSSMISQWVASLATSTSGNREEGQFRRKQGDLIYVEFTSTCFHQRDREVICLVARDISQRKQLEQMRSDGPTAGTFQFSALQRLGQSLLTPVSNLEQIFTELGQELPESLQRQIQQGVQALQQLHFQTQNLRLLPGGPSPQNRVIPFGLRKLLHQTQALFQAEADTRGIQLEYTIEATIPDEIYGNPEPIQQILFNLLQNALHSTHTGSVVLRVKQPRPVGDDGQLPLIFAVIDTGPGIPLADQALITYQFEAKTPMPSLQDGGLGLLVCKQLVEQLQGRIWFTSLEEQGSTFSFSLNLEIDPPEGMTFPVAEEPPLITPEPEPLATTPITEAAPAPAEPQTQAAPGQIAIPEEMRHLLPNFLRSRQQDVEKLQQALVRDDYDHVRVLGANIAGISEMYGFDTLHQLGQSLEQLAPTADALAMAAQIEALEAYLHQLELQLGLS